MFSKKPADDPRLPAATKPQGRTMSGNSTFSVIGTDVTIKGDVSATADLHVDGRIEGDITCASLVQGETSTIEGSIEAESARLSGRLTGSIRARDLVILRSARIEGDVHYDALTIEQGAQVDGRFSHREPGKPAAKPASAAPAGSDDEPKLTLAG